MKKKLLNKIGHAQFKLNEAEDLLLSMEDDIDDLQSEINLEDVKDGLINAAKSDDWDINCEHDISYENDLEKRKILFNGIKHGYSSALFWVADHFGLVEFFENEIGHGFEHLKKD